MFAVLKKWSVWESNPLQTDRKPSRIEPKRPKKIQNSLPIIESFVNHQQRFLTNLCTKI
jgi:hypothetical protein